MSISSTKGWLDSAPSLFRDRHLNNCRFCRIGVAGRSRAARPGHPSGRFEVCPCAGMVMRVFFRRTAGIGWPAAPYRGHVVEGADLAGRTTLGTLVKMNDWNEYTGHRARRSLHSNREQYQPGLFGIEMEGTTKVYVRNIWLT
jgi:hypothetical protein